MSLGPDEADAASAVWPPHITPIHPENITQLAALMALAQFFLGSDSGPSHIANELGLPGVCLVQSLARIELWYPQNSSLDLIQEIKPECDGCDPLNRPRCPSCVAHLPPSCVIKKLDQYMSVFN